MFGSSDRVLLKQNIEGKRLGFSIVEILGIIEVYKTPTGEEGQIKPVITRINEKRGELEQKRRDFEDTMGEMDTVEENCFERLAELGVGQ